MGKKPFKLCEAGPQRSWDCGVQEGRVLELSGHTATLCPNAPCGVFVPKGSSHSCRMQEATKVGWMNRQLCPLLSAPISPLRDTVVGPPADPNKSLQARPRQVPLTELGGTWESSKGPSGTQALQSGTQRQKDGDAGRGSFVFCSSA